ncbi:3-hydroxyacyl-ACP dehydratase FabZ family protein [Fructilactobacillus florum]|uniref:(3R)-hydroxymyristoyl-ACP dehydratase n=1 Tax=Fructilactobacillus florum DSM 22689 = JCM 16035 TaxID=1423745 RepID=A0A0R2CMP2_9LACO|nr:3-hydroxyacyl-ACP dehydratase FabZ family protein [Fructilactobacillus florum]KRM92338.1 (3R)-hydroxymyristoyl-ACP dehydratase [Fructilactobacillus florum DSM 22689 = JCM 16035]
MKFEVNQLIPQRYPFEMIDQIISVVPGESAIARKNITVNEWYFANGNRLELPRPLILESLAQTGVVAILSMPEHAGANVFFGGIKQADFYGSMRPGAELELRVQLTKLKRNIGVGHGEVYCGDQRLVAADLMFAIEAQGE